MARKNGLNRKEQIQCAKALTEGVPAKMVAKKFGTSVEIVNRFTQKKLDEVKKKASDRETAQKKASKARRAKAQVLSEAIEIGKDDFE